MFRRAAMICVCTTLGCLLAVPAAFGWSNGNGNGYGTHDWLLEEAIEVARQSNPAAGGWIDWETARLATDDPDTNQTDVYWHTFREIGRSRGGPQKIADLYYEAALAFRADDKVGASEKLGVLSHYYGDIVQPFHTTWAAFEVGDAQHYPYELAVDRLTRHPGDSPEWAIPTTPRPVTDVRERGIAAAYFARGRYDDLYASFSSNHSVDSTNTVAHRITGEVLSRAVNDLADLILALPAAKGLSPAPAKVTASISQSYPGLGRKVCAYAKCTTAQGKPMQGVAVVFFWPMPDGSVKREVAYTDASGVAHDWEVLGPYALMKWQWVGVSARSSGATTGSGTNFKVTPRLAAGRKGIATVVSTRRPKAGRIVRATTVCRDTHGRPVRGLPVTFTWTMRSRTVTLKAVTDSRGVAHRSYRIGKGKGYTGRVTARVTSDSTRRSSYAAFVPR